MMGRVREKLLRWVGIDIGSKVQTDKAKRLKAISNGDSELREWLGPTIDLVEVRDSARLISKRIKDQDEENTRLSLEIESKMSKITELERMRDDLEGKREDLIRSSGDLSTLPEGCLRHELALDSVLQHLPQLSTRLGRPDGDGPVVLPARTCNSPAKMEFFNLEKWDWRIHTFTAPKSERYELRYSEDRIGFAEFEGICRLIAVDGVGGSSHGRHLAQRICETALEGKDRIKDRLHLALKTYGEELSCLSNGAMDESKMAFWKDKKNEQGSACVLAIVDVDIESGTVGGWQMGDTVVFAEVMSSGGSKSWMTFPDIGAGEFDCQPEQLNSLNPEGVAGLARFSLENATGRVVVCTDGMADYMLKKGVEKVVFGMLEYDDPKELTDLLRLDGIADDDLSMIMLSPIVKVNV